MIERFAEYDSRGYRTLGVVEGYSAWASFYDDTSDDRLDIALLSAVHLAPTIRPGADLHLVVA